MMPAAGNPTVRLAPAATLPDQHHALVERLCRPGAGQGPLAGLTFVAKDCLDLAGRPPGCGLTMRGTDAAPAEDAAIIRDLLAAGATLVAMAQMTPLAFEPSGENPALGRPLNPHDPGYVCGGSSSGSAVAVAAGLADFAIGTDTAGSVRIPAHCCGVAGWKPSRTLVSKAGVMPLADSLDCVGFLARDVAMLARLAAALPVAGKATIRGVAVAIDALDESATAIGDTCRHAARLAGLPLREVTALPVIRACDEPVFTLLQGEAFRAHSARIAAGAIDAGLARRLAKGAASTDADLAAARETLAGLARQSLAGILAEDEVLLLPGMPGPTPRIAACDPSSPEFSARALYGLSAYTRFANGLDLPVISIPAGFDRTGLPIGVQLVARTGRDADLLALAQGLSAALAAAPYDQISRSGPMP